MDDTEGRPREGAAHAAAPVPVSGRRLTRRNRQMLTQVGAYLLFAVVVVALVLAVDWAEFKHFFLDRDTWNELWPDIFLTGALNTIKYTALAFVCGLALALVLALMRLSPVAPYRWAATAFIEFFRGLPALVVIIFMGLAVPLVLGWNFPTIEWLGLSSPNVTAGLVALIMVCAAYMAETLRAGLQAVPKGQTEAARSLGMSYSRTLFTITIPQAVRIVIPPLTNEFVLLIKDTALISVIGMQAAEMDLTAFGQNGLTTYSNATPLLATAVFYLLISLPLTQLVAWMERRQKRAR